MVELPVIESCDGCGACCFEQSSPPGYLRLIVWGHEHPEDDEDAARLKALPPEARESIDAYMTQLRAGVFDVLGDMPCIWLDMATRRCRWYEHRPSICRDFEKGSESCGRWREQYEGMINAKH